MDIVHIVCIAIFDLVLDNTINSACGENYKTFCHPTSIELNVLISKATRAPSCDVMLIYFFIEIRVQLGYSQHFPVVFECYHFSI